MKSLKNLYILLGLFFQNIAFADIVCIYNQTDKNLLIQKVTTGCWIFEQLKLNKEGLRYSARKLNDTKCLNEIIHAKEGFLIEYNYGYKKGAKTTSIELISEDKKSKLNIDLLSDQEISHQGIYQVTQEYTGPFNKKTNPKEHKWWLSCDKMIIISK